MTRITHSKTLNIGIEINSIQAFLSYSHRDRFLAAGIRNSLASYGIKTFLAHEDLQPSQEWQDEILRKLQECEIFFLLLTHSFKPSNWTDQETGIAVALNKIIVPLKVTVNPYGFVARYQAQSFEGLELDEQLDPARVDEGCWRVVRTLAQRFEVGNRVKNFVIRSFAQSRTFKEAAEHALYLQGLEPFTSAQIEEIVKVSCRNSQIYSSFAARDYVRKLIMRNRMCLPGRLHRLFVRVSGSTEFLKVVANA